MLFIFGGRSADDDDGCMDLPIQVYNVENTKWTTLNSLNKFRHCSFLINEFFYMHGGFNCVKQSEPLDEILVIDLIKLIKTSSKLVRYVQRSLQNNKNSLMHKYQSLLDKSSFISNQSDGNNTITSNNDTSSYNNKNCNNVSFISNATTENKGETNRPYILEKPLFASVIRRKLDEIIVLNKVEIEKNQDDSTLSFRFIKGSKEKSLINSFIRNILNPSEWKKRSSSYAKSFNFSPNQIVELTEKCKKIVENQPKILKLTSPIKVFGDVHGQIKDLMKFFESFGEPSEDLNGDIDAIDYLFLGDYVDRGIYSLDTICLLMALKVKYPNKVYLIRGNHEDRLINMHFGFYSECCQRLNENSLEGGSVFNTINNFFEYLPLAAIIDNQILCIHGGLGANFKNISDIENIERPIVVYHEPKNLNQQIVMDILWSDPSDTDQINGIKPNFARNSSKYGIIVKFGPDIVEEFLKANNLNMIIRGHECVLDGFERFAGGSLITVFSATDYCGRHNNAGAMLFIKSNCDIIPYLMYPEKAENKNWINSEEFLKDRPVTPPRTRNKGNY